MIPSLRAGSVQRQPCSARMWSTVSSSWQPPPIAYVSAAAIHSFSTARLAQPAEDLVHEPEVADREEQVGDLAAVEVREVQAGAEDRAGRRSARARRRRRAARRSRSPSSSRTRSIAASNGAVVVSSSALRWRGLRSSTMPTLAAPLDGRLAEVDAARVAQLVEMVERELRRAAASRRSDAGRTRGRPARRRGTRPARSPGPSLSFCSCSRSAATCSRVGSSGTCSAAA